MKATADEVASAKAAKAATAGLALGYASYLAYSSKTHNSGMTACVRAVSLARSTDRAYPPCLVTEYTERLLGGGH